jgi:hypothetical protein
MKRRAAIEAEQLHLLLLAKLPGLCELKEGAQRGAAEIGDFGFVIEFCDCHGPYPSVVQNIDIDTENVQTVTLVTAAFHRATMRLRCHHGQWIDGLGSCRNDHVADFQGEALSFAAGRSSSENLISAVRLHELAERLVVFPAFSAVQMVFVRPTSRIFAKPVRYIP